MLRNKQRQLKQFLEKYKNLPVQGSEKWVKNREGTIGGSELDRLLKDESGLVATKIGLKKIPDMLAMRWGSLLEDTLRNITSLLLRTAIYEAGSIPSAEVSGKTYSMDGMGIVRFLCDQWDDKPYEFFMFMTTLFEFKCPYSRQIVPGEVYRDYIPQVKSGMCDLAIPEIALYIEGVFRISRFEELGNNPHVESWLHRDGNPRGLLPMAYGFIGFYMESPDVPDDDDAWDVFNWIQSGEMDFAKLENPASLNRLLKFATKTGDVKRWQSAIQFQPQELSRCEYFRDQKIPIATTSVDMDEQLVAFYRHCRLNGLLPLGILGIKLLDLNIVPVEKEPGYTKQFEPQIHTALEKINRLQQVEDPGDRELAYNELYGLADTAKLETEIDLITYAM